MSETPTRPVTAVILVAAGSGQRLGYGIPKAAVPLGGEPILMHALRGIVASGTGSQVCIALPPGEDTLRRRCEEFRQELADGGPLLSIVDGGATRADSVRAGMAALMEGIDRVAKAKLLRGLFP